MEIFRLDEGGECFPGNTPQSPGQNHNIHDSESEVTSSARNLPDVVILTAAGEDRSLENTPPLANRITAIKPAAKNPNRANIFIDDHYDFSLDLAQLADFKLKVGQHLTDTELENYRHASAFGKLYQRTLEWVLTRPHSVKETRDYLTRKKFRRAQENHQRAYNAEKPHELRQQYHLKTKPLPEITDADIDQVIQRLIDRNYLNDVNFTTYYIENRFVKKGISKRRLEQELRQKGVSPEIITQAFQTTPRDERAEILKIIEKKKNKYQDQQKLIQYLVRQGFNYSLICEVINQ